MDEGDIIAQEETKIESQETAPELEARLAIMGGKLLNQKLMPYLLGDIFLEEQLDKATYCGKFTAKDGLISLNKDSLKRIVNKGRAFRGKIKLRLQNEEIDFNGKKILLEDLMLTSIRGKNSLEGVSNLHIGSLVLKNKQVYLKVKEGWLVLEKVQVPGKKEME